MASNLEFRQSVASSEQDPDKLVEIFFSRPGEQVAADLAIEWMRHEDRNQIFSGNFQNGCLLVIQTLTGVNMYEIVSAIVYSDKFTTSRWKRSRAPEISQASPGTLFVYESRGHSHAFIRTGNNAENIGLHLVRKTQSTGEPRQDQSEITTGNIGSLFGLNHGEKAYLSPITTQGRRGFAVDSNQPNHMLTNDRIEEIIKLLLE